jgi:UDP-N-acetylglucosamine acyltransferase
MAIHPTAIIESPAGLGQHISVGPFSYIGPHVTLGDGCVIGPHVTILPYTTLGAGCRVHAGAVIGDLPQDLAFDESTISYVRVGPNCVLREGVTIHRGTRPNSVTQVGEGCLLMANSHLAHNVIVGNQVILANGALVAGYGEIGDRAFISGNCLIHQFARVGRLAMMAGGSAIQKDLPPFCITRSSTSNTLIGLNVIGLRRAGVSPSERQQLKQALRLLYLSGLSTPDAIAKLEQELPSPLVQELCGFVRQSQRGICKFFRRGSDRNGNRDDDF